MTGVPWLPLWTVLRTSESVADIRTQSRRPNSRLKNGRARLLPSRTEHQTCLSGSAGASPSHPIEYFNKLLSPKTPICVRHYTSIRGGDMARRRCAKKIWFTHAQLGSLKTDRRFFQKSSSCARATQGFWDCPARPIYGMMGLTTTYGTGSPVNLADAEPCLNEGAAVFFAPAWFLCAGPAAGWFYCPLLRVVLLGFGHRRLPSAWRRKKPSQRSLRSPNPSP